MRKTLVIMATLALSVAPQQLQARHHRRAPLPPARPADLDPSAEGAPAEMAAPEQPQSSEAPRIFVDAPTPPERPEEFSARPADPSEPPLAYAAPIEPERQPAPFVAPALAGAACLSKLKEAGVESKRRRNLVRLWTAVISPRPCMSGLFPYRADVCRCRQSRCLIAPMRLRFSDFIARLAARSGRKRCVRLLSPSTRTRIPNSRPNRMHGARVTRAAKKSPSTSRASFSRTGARSWWKASARLRRAPISTDFAKAPAAGSPQCSALARIGYHENHLHLDTETHGRHDMHYCH